MTDISRATNLAISTAHRLLTTLQPDRFVQFNADSARWEIGVDAYIIGSAFLNFRDIARGARPLLRRLMEESGETANLAILSDDTAVYMEQVESRQTMRAICKPGGRVALHSTSLGKSMLAAMRSEEVARIPERRGMTRITLPTSGCRATGRTPSRRRRFPRWRRPMAPSREDLPAFSPS